MFKKVKWSTYLVLLAFLLIVGVVGGCSNDSNDKSKQSSDNNDDEAPTVRVFKSHLGKGKLPESDDPHVEYIKEETGDRKSTRLNSSHVAISYAVFCLKKKNK